MHLHLIPWMYIIIITTQWKRHQYCKTQMSDKVLHVHVVASHHMEMVSLRKSVINWMLVFRPVDIIVEHRPTLWSECDRSQREIHWWIAETRVWNIHTIHLSDCLGADRKWHFKCWFYSDPLESFHSSEHEANNICLFIVEIPCLTWIIWNILKLLLMLVNHNNLWVGTSWEPHSLVVTIGKASKCNM
jgi:hypothetical protein